ncbi:MAG: penicillin acylase family protein, partial [Rhodospirillaceae bacterium]|nr:penicillin acylase family protein [Rhodospirillaceae bacterium]
FRLNRAGSVREARELMRGYHAPVQNMVVADTQGTIGFFTIGDVPLRAGGDGTLPVPGWTGEFDWTGLVPVDQLPQAIDPEAGVFVNANNLAMPAGSGAFLGYGYDEAYRAQRITDLLAAEGPATPDRMAAIMMDTVSLEAQTLLPVMLEVRVETPRDANALAILRRWDFAMDRDRPEPLIFVAWQRELNRALYADELGEALFADYWNLRPTTVSRMLTQSTDWCDDVSTDERESCQDILRTTLTTVLDRLTEAYGEDLEAWRWGDVHIAYLTHRIYGRIPIVGSWFNLSIETDGGDFTVNRGAMSIWSESLPYAHVHGAGFRAIYPLDELSSSRFIIATGQSGHPFSPHYGDMVERWRDGEWITIANIPATLADVGLGSFTLRPASE